MSNFPLKISTNKLTRNALISCYELMSTYSDLIKMENSVSDSNIDKPITSINYHLVKAVIKNEFTITNEEHRYHFEKFISLSKQYKFTKDISNTQWNNLLNKTNNVKKRKQEHPYHDEIINVIDYFMENASIIARKEFDIYDECPLKIDFDEKRKASWGGCHGISIALTGYIPKVYDIENDTIPYKYFFPEYLSFKHPISGFYTCDWRLTLLAVLCHEFSHFIQYQLYYYDKEKYQIMRKPHGDGFKKIYRHFRDIFVNPYLNNGDKFTYK